MSEALGFLNERPLYLHFLDRELGQAVGFTLNHDRMERVLKCLALGTHSRLYCGISLIWENTGLSESSRQILAAAASAGVLDPVSYKGTIEEFFESHQRLYLHDAERYPVYFEQGIERIRTIQPSLYKPDDTTEHLVDRLTAWAAAKVPRDQVVEGYVHERTLRALRERDSQALTFRFFTPYIEPEKAGAEAVGIIRRQISLGYSTHYMEFADGDIATGIDGLSFFDAQLSRNFPMNDVPLLSSILQRLGFEDLLEQPWENNWLAWQTFLGIRGRAAHHRLTRQIAYVLRSFYGLAVQSAQQQPSQYAVRTRINALIHKYLDSASDPSRPHVGMRIESRLEEAERLLLAAISRMYHAPDLALHLTLNRQEFMSEKTDVLIVTATQLETESVIEAFQTQHSSGFQRLFVGDNTFYDLGRIGGARIVLVQSEMGSGGPSGSALTVSEAITALAPSAVILVGIAFGVDQDRESLGDVLVSKQVLAYELQRIGSSPAGPKVTFRGDRTSASPRLLDRCRSAALDWKKHEVRFGLVLSGEKLIDEIDFRNTLVSQAGVDVVGGEMEGAGLYASAYRHKVDWIIIKSICDWADGSKNYGERRRQVEAAQNSASFVAHLVAIGGLA